MAPQTAFPIFGKVTLATKGYGSTAVNQRGARIWIKDRTEGTVRISFLATAANENVYITQTDNNGDYILDLANLTTAYAAGDKIRVYCEWDGSITWRDYTLLIADGIKEIDFTLHKHSGLIDGCKGAVSDADRKYGLHKLGTGMRKGLKGMGRSEGWLADA